MVRLRVTWATLGNEFGWNRNVRRGKKKQKWQELPIGWWGRLNAFCRKNWTHDSGDVFDIYTFTKVSRRTLSSARKRNRITEATFGVLVEAVGCDNPDDLLKVLSPPEGPAEVGKGGAAAVMASEEGIPADVEKLLGEADKLDAEGKYGEALALIEKALKAAERAGHAMAIVRARIDLAEYITRTGVDLARGESLLKDCLEQLPRGRDDKRRESALIYLAHIATAQGRVHEGKSLAVEALESAGSRKDRFTMGRALIELGHAEEMLGNLPEALRALGEAIEHFRAERRGADAKSRQSAATNLAGCLATRAMVLQHQGNAPEMLVCLTEAEQILREGTSGDNLARTLLAKSRVLCALSRFDQGVQAVQEAWDIFGRIGNFRWLLQCAEVLVRLAMQFGQADEALRFGAMAVGLAKERGTPHDLADALGQMAALCREHGLTEPARKFLAEATSVAREHELHDLLADCLLDGVGEGGAGSDEHRALLNSALEHLLAALTATQVKGRRAVLMGRMATVYGRLGNLAEARSWLEQALTLFEEIGDAGGSLNVLGRLAALAREEGNREAAIELMQSLIERAKGKPFEHFGAGAHHDLVHLELAQGDVSKAEEHFKAAKALCKGNRFPDIEEALFETEQRLGMAARYHKAAPSTLAEMLRGLRAWTDRFPEQAEAILPAWFFLFGAEAWSNCRSLLGVKFLVHAPDVGTFESFAREWSDCGDLFIYHPASKLRCERGVDLIPWDGNLMCPRTLWLAGVKAKEGGEVVAEEGASAKRNDPGVAKAMVEMLHKIPYYGTCFDGQVPGLPAAKLYVVGRKHRLPQDVRDTLLGVGVEELISSRVFVLPREKENGADTAFAMTVAWEGGHLPVFYGDPAASDELTLQREVSVELPRSGRGQSALRRLMAEVGTDAGLALTRLVEVLELARWDAGETVAAKLRVYGFKAGARRVLHPALIL